MHVHVCRFLSCARAGPQRLWALPAQDPSPRPRDDGWVEERERGLARAQDSVDRRTNVGNLQANQRRGMYSVRYAMRDRWLALHVHSLLCTCTCSRTCSFFYDVSSFVAVLVVVTLVDFKFDLWLSSVNWHVPCLQTILFHFGYLVNEIPLHARVFGYTVRCRYGHQGGASWLDDHHRASGAAAVLSSRRCHVRLGQKPGTNSSPFTALYELFRHLFQDIVNSAVLCKIAILITRSSCKTKLRPLMIVWWLMPSHHL